MKDDYFTHAINSRMYTIRKRIEGVYEMVLDNDHGSKVCGEAGVVEWDKEGQLWYFDSETIRKDDRQPILDKIASYQLNTHHSK